EAGADIINDVWGAKKDPQIAKVAAEYNVPIVLMHNRNNKNYTNLIEDMISDLNEIINIATEAGVMKENIILDPGVGFAKTMADNYEVLKHLNEFVKMDYPVLLGTSRKSFINEILPTEPSERDNATGATTCLGITQGVKLHRVHDVKRNVELAKMKFYGFHGLLPEETKLGQRFNVTVELYVSLKEAGTSDEMDDSVNYGLVFEVVKNRVEGKPFNLIEALAERISEDLLKEFPKI